MANKNMKKLTFAGIALITLLNHDNISSNFDIMKATAAKIIDPGNVYEQVVNDTINNIDEYNESVVEAEEKTVYRNEQKQYTSSIGSEVSQIVKPHDLNNEITYDEETGTVEVEIADTTTLTSTIYTEFINYADSNRVTYKYSEFYDVDEALALSGATQSKTYTTLICDINDLPSEELIYNTIVKNNEEFFNNNTNDAYYRLPEETVKEIAELVTQSLALNIDFLDNESKQRVYEELAHLKVYGADSSNPTVSNDIYNALYRPDASLIIDVDQVNKYGSHDAFIKTVLHEAGHIFQRNYAVSNENVTYVGASEYYRTLSVNPLTWSFINETTAESDSMTQTNSTKPLVYSKQYNFLRALDLTALISPDYDEKAFEKANINCNQEDIYAMFNADTYREKVEIINMLYSLDIALSRRVDFYNSYTSDETIDEVSANLYSDALYTNSRYFYTNLAERVENGGATIEDCYYLIKMYEIDLNACINYGYYPDMYKDFISNYSELQEEFFNYLASKNNVDISNIINGFELYSQNQEYINISSLDWLQTSEKNFIVNSYGANSFYANSDTIRSLNETRIEMSK